MSCETAPGQSSSSMRSRGVAVELGTAGAPVPAIGAIGPDIMAALPNEESLPALPPPEPAGRAPGASTGDRLDATSPLEQLEAIRSAVAATHARIRACADQALSSFQALLSELELGHAVAEFAVGADEVLLARGVAVEDVLPPGNGRLHHARRFV